MQPFQRTEYKADSLCMIKRTKGGNSILFEDFVLKRFSAANALTFGSQYI